MQGKEYTPNLEKKITISFPLINPDPTIEPIIASIAKIEFFINI